jgi:uncharacterized protein involved in exopolysaccharide biosynthesis
MTDIPADAEAESSPLGPGEVLRPLREHAGFITVFIMSAILSALALTYIYSERYQAAETIFFKPSDVTLVVRHGQEALGSRLPVPTQKNVTQTITQLVTSGVVLGRVVNDLHLDVAKARDVSGPWYRHYYQVVKYQLKDFADAAWKILKYGAIIDDPVAGAMYKLYKSIKITNDDSYVYTVAVSADSLGSAVEQTHKLVEVVIEQLNRDDRLGFERRTAELIRLRGQKSDEIEQLNAAMQTLLANNRVASIDDELKTLTDRLSKLRQEGTDVRADLDQSEAKVAATAEKLRVAVPATAGDGNPVPIAHPSRISPEDYGKLTTKKLDAEVDSRGLRARLGAIDHAYNELVPRIQVLTEVKAQEVLLAVKLASAKQDYAALTDGIEELAIREATGETELHVQARPNGSVRPVSPIKIYHVAAAAILATLVAVGLAFVLDFFQIRLFLPPPGGRKTRSALRKAVPAPTMAPSGAD